MSTYKRLERIGAMGGQPYFKYTANLETPTQGAYFNAFSNCLIGFTLSSLGGGCRVQLRRRDETNYWFFELVSQITLYKRSGSSYTQTSVVWTWHDGDRVLIYAFGASIYLYVNGILAFTQIGTATDYQTNGGGKIELLLTGCIINNLFAVNLASRMQIPIEISGATQTGLNWSDLANLQLYSGITLFDGDSRLAENVPSLTMQDALIAPYNYGLSKSAVSGQGMSTVLTRIPTYITPLVSRMLPIWNKRVAVVWAGVNDSATTAANIYNLYTVPVCAALRSMGLKVVLCTEIDAQDANRITNGWPTKYLELNTLIKSDSSIYDGLVDLGANVNLQDATNTTYFKVDKVHPNVAVGQPLVASLIAPVLNSVLSI